MLRHATVAAAHAMGFLFIGTVWADDNAGVTLPPVVVTASRLPTEGQALPQSISVISATQIENTPALELDNVLRLVPGIDLLGYSGEAQHPTSGSLGMRGLGGSGTGISRGLVMVDSVPVNDPFFGYIQWGRVPLDNIDRVEVVRGGGSPLWGDYAEGGVINVITRKPSAQQAVVDGSGGSYGTYSASGYVAYFPADMITIQAFASADGTSGFQQVPEYERAPFNVPTSYKATNVQAKATFEPNSDFVAHLALAYHHNHQQLETTTDENSQDYYTLTADAEKHFAGNASLTATLFTAYSRFTTNNSTYFPEQDDLADTTDTLNEIHAVRAHDFGGSLVWSQQLSGMLKSYMMGVDFRSISGIDNTDHFIAPDFSPEFTTTVSQGSQTLTGVFGQVIVVPVTPLQFTASARYQWVRNTDGYDGTLGGAGAVPDRHFTSFDPRVDARYAFGGGFAVRGAYYQSFRAPNLADQFYSYAAGGFVMLPAPFLEPEKLKGGEVGLDYSTPKLRAQFTVYSTRIGNYILTEPTTNSIYTPAGWYVVQNFNVASVRAQGFEAEVNADIGGGVSATLAYTYASSIVKSNPLDPASVGQQLTDVPRNKVAGGLSYRNPDGWRAATQMYWVDRTAWANLEHSDPGYPGATSADAHFLLDLTAGYQFSKNVEAYVKVQNALDRRYIATSYSAPSAQIIGAPSQVFGGLRVVLP